MKSVDVLDRRWRVRRRWLPWKRRIRELPDVPGGYTTLGDDPISAILSIFLLVLAIPALIVTALLLVELLLLLALLPVFVLVRLLLPVPWTIEVWWRPRQRLFLGWVEAYEEPAEGWRASRARIARLREATDHLGRGDLFAPPPLPDGREAPGRRIHPAPEARRGSGGAGPPSSGR